MRLGRVWQVVSVAVVAAAVLGGCDALVGVTPPATSGGTSGGINGGGSATPSVAASLLEQLSLERINRARLHPAAEALAGGIAIDEGIPGQLDAVSKPAVALNTVLCRIAREHSQDMLDRNYFAHETPDGVSPFDRMASAGYLFTTAGENLAWRGTTGGLDEVATVEGQHTDLFVDAGIEGRGHRLTMLNASFREIGVGILRGNLTKNGTTFDSVMHTQDYGTQPSAGTFVLGVVYADNNNNGQYDYGEGTANATVTMGRISKLTNAGGGYSFEVSQAGTVTVQFSTGHAQSIAVRDGAPNIKIDFVDGTSLVINLGLGPLE